MLALQNSITTCQLSDTPCKFLIVAVQKLLNGFAENLVQRAACSVRLLQTPAVPTHPALCFQKPAQSLI